LFKTQPIVAITEETPGVMGIGFDYDVGRKGATVDLPCEVGLWLAPPGSVIVLEDMGPLNGRWLVNSFSRSLFDSNADIQLHKPEPKLREPTQNTVTLPTWGQPQTSYQSVYGPHPNTLVKPVPSRYLKEIQGLHDTAGLPGYPANDWMARAGSPVVAPENGKIIKLSGHPPLIGPVDGVHGPFGWSLYLQGESGTIYYMTHLGERIVDDDNKLPFKVFDSQLIGKIGDYAAWGGADHVHIGLHGGTVTNDLLTQALDPPDPTPGA
jgi:hypothetical protein